jgi:mono/diheme cytochrome c family protein
MSLAGAAAAMGIPESLVERSAAARAAESDAGVDEILAAWAGGESVAAAPSPETQPEPEVEEAAVEEGAAEEPAEEGAETEPAQEPPPTPVIESPAPTGEPSRTAPTRAPVPAEVTVAEAAHLPEVITVPTAGIKERTNFVIPRWLVGLMLVAPLFALFALGGSATGACGEATELTVDVISGEIVNCDGTEFTGAGAGGAGTDFLVLGGDLYAGSVTPAATCAGCHGANGQGSGTFPALTGVLTTFGVCEDHVEWVRLGSGGFDTYGDTNKPVAGGMPPHGSLSEEQLRSVVAFERVRFGGADPDETLVDCGLTEPEGEDGADGEEESPADEEGSPTETTVPPDASG